MSFLSLECNVARAEKKRTLFRWMFLLSFRRFYSENEEIHSEISGPFRRFIATEIYKKKNLYSRSSSRSSENLL